MKIHHIGYAVKRINRAMKGFTEIGYSFGPIIDDVERNIELVFGTRDGYCIELVSPLDKKSESPVDHYLTNTVGTPYHICYETDKFDEDLEKLIANGFKVIIEPKPAIAFNGKRVVFIMNIGFGLMELVEG